MSIESVLVKPKESVFVFCKGFFRERRPALSVVNFAHKAFYIELLRLLNFDFKQRVNRIVNCSTKAAACAIYKICRKQRRAAANEYKHEHRSGGLNVGSGVVHWYENAKAEQNHSEKEQEKIYSGVQKTA